MSHDRDLSLVLEAWLRDGPDRMPDRVSDVVRSRIAGQRQRPAWPLGFDGSGAVDPRLLIAAVVAALTVAVIAVALIGGAPSIPVPPRPAPIPSETSPREARSSKPSPTSPVGRGLVLLEIVDTNMDNQLRYIAPDRRALPFLPGFGGHQRTAAWRPDGSGLAFAGRRGGDTSPWMHLHEAGPDGSSPHRLATDCALPACAEETDPAYSPDGTRLLAVRLADVRDGEPTRSVLVVYDLATGRGTEIAGTSFPYATHDIGHPRWSPDGDRIVFHVAEGPPTNRRRLVFPEPVAPGRSSVYVVNVDGSGLRQITPTGLDAGDPDWSPDGTMIVFGPTPWHLWLYGLDQTDWAIRLVRPDGTDLHTILANGEAGTPSWTADGRILFANSNGTDSSIRVIDPDGSDNEAVASFRMRDVPIYPVQQPTR